MILPVSVNSLNDFDRAVYFTLVYSDLFDFPLTTNEINERLPKVWDLDFLVGKKKSSQANKLIKSVNKIEKSLKKLINKNLIIEKKNHWQNFYCLKNRTGIIGKRLKKTKYLAQKEESIAEFLEIAKKIPFIKAVFLTGSTAVDNASQTDDLDFLIITEDKSLWLSRFLLILISKLIGKQPSLDGEHSKDLDRSNAWCLNMWLTKKNLALSDKNKSVYLAYELLQMRPLWERDDLTKYFYWSNRGLNQYLFLPEGKQFRKSKKVNKKYLLALLNYLAYFLQLVYRKLFFKNENFSLGLNFAYFNNGQRSENIFAKIKAKMRDV